jgi:hypothetical protein
VNELRRRIGRNDGFGALIACAFKVTFAWSSCRWVG